jgi:hypothetical protein
MRQVASFLAAGLTDGALGAESADDGAEEESSAGGDSEDDSEDSESRGSVAESEAEPEISEEITARAVADVRAAHAERCRRDGTTVPYNGPYAPQYCQVAPGEQRAAKVAAIVLQRAWSQLDGRQRR